MATKDQAQQEQDEFSASFGEDVQKPEMTEDEAFGLTSPSAETPSAETPDEETPDEDAAEVVEEPGEPVDTQAAETSTDVPADTKTVAVEPSAESSGDVEVMSPEDIQREKSWMGRLKAKEAELKAREEALGKSEPTEPTEPGETQAQESAEPAVTEAMEGAMEKVDSGELTFDQAMKTLESDFGPDFPKMLSVIAKYVSGQVSDERVSSVRNELDGVVNDLRSDKEKSHFETISEAHPDFIEVAGSPEFKAYVQGLPASEQEAANGVINGGSARQINKLLSDYKATKEPVKEPAKDVVDESAADAAEGVRSSGLKIPEKPAKADDYEAAWQEWA